MKLSKKLIVTAVGLALGGVSLATTSFDTNANVANAATSTTKTTTVKLRLNHNSYVYDKNGKRLKKYKGKSALIKKSQKLTIKGKIEPISSAKRYYFYGNDASGKITPYWLVYKKIKGDYYYSIGNKGYIKCINVKTVNGDDNRLIASQATVIVKPLIGNVAYAEDSSGHYTTKVLKKGQKLVINDTDILGDQLTYSYHIKGTKYWVSAQDLKANPRPSNTVTYKLRSYDQLIFLTNKKQFLELKRLKKLLFS